MSPGLQLKVRQRKILREADFLSLVSGLVELEKGPGPRFELESSDRCNLDPSLFVDVFSFEKEKRPPQSDRIARLPQPGREIAEGLLGRVL